MLPSLVVRLVGHKVEHAVQLVAGNAQARGLVGRFRQQFLHVAQALFAQKLAVASRHEAAFALHGFDEPERFQVGIRALRRDDADA